jgi:hypothetical protein
MGRLLAARSCKASPIAGGVARPDPEALEACTRSRAPSAFRAPCPPEARLLGP